MPTPAPSGWARLRAWVAGTGLGNKLAIALAAASIGSAIGTYAALTPDAAGNIDPQLVRGLLLLDLILLLLLAAVIAQRLVALWVQRRRNAAGSKLHVRLVGLFSVVAVGPAILMATFSILFFNLGLQAWFSTRVNTAVQESVAVAEAYIQEHRKAIQGDVLGMAADINREATALLQNPYYFSQTLRSQADLRGLSEAVVVTSAGQVLARAGLSLSMDFDKVPTWAIRDANAGLVSVLASEREERVRALVKLDSILDAYLYVGRFVDPRVIGHLDRTRNVAQQYAEMERARTELEMTFTLLFAVVGLLILLVAVWFGLWMANRLAEPIGALIKAAERVGAGDLGARVAEIDGDDETSALGRAFNRMTSEIGRQQDQLIAAHHLSEDRRRFTEAVLGGVTAGVLGTDTAGLITIANPSAVALLGSSEETLAGRSLTEAVPELETLFEPVVSRERFQTQGQVAIVRANRSRTLFVRVVREEGAGEAVGTVVTFDDVTDLVTAQRTAAWADIARRIAHEIKNPLTPIQLAAERLKRKYLREVKTEPEVFAQCTDTIVRQVGDIGRMVDEFSSFARMPAPVFAVEDFSQLIRQAVFLQREAHPEYDYPVSLPALPPVRCDARQISRVFTNLLQNAADAIEGRDPPRDSKPLPRGVIDVSASMTDDGRLMVAVADNGKGLPKENRDRLVEPYVTTRAKGTGLGLAIVRKIMEEHGGSLELDDGPEGGAVIRLILPAAALQSETEEVPTAQPPRRVTHGA